MIKDDDLKVIIAKEEYLKGKKQLQNFEDQKENPFKKWLLVASILLAISLTSFWFLTTSTDSPKKLYAQYFKAYTNVVAPVSRNDDAFTDKKLAFINYDTKQYKKAIISFNAILETVTLEEQKIINLYKAISFLALQKPNDCITILQNYNNVNNRFKDKYLWYLSLAYLQKEDVKNAKKTLEILAKEKYNFKQKETRLLLDSLD